MSKLTAVILTAAICLPLGAVLQGSASADRRTNSLPGDVAVRHRMLLTGGFDSASVVGHPQLSRAQNALHEAVDALEASQRDNEPFWSDSSGHSVAVAKVREQIDAAARTLDRTAAWVTNGMIANESRAR